MVDADGGDRRSNRVPTDGEAAASAQRRHREAARVRLPGRQLRRRSPLLAPHPEDQRQAPAGRCPRAPPPPAPPSPTGPPAAAPPHAPRPQREPGRPTGQPPGQPPARTPAGPQPLPDTQLGGPPDPQQRPQRRGSAAPAAAPADDGLRQEHATAPSAAPPPQGGEGPGAAGVGNQTGDYGHSGLSNGGTQQQQ